MIGNIDREVLCEAIKTLRPFISPGDGHTSLEAMHFYAIGKKLQVVATDRYTIAKMEISCGECSEQEMTIRAADALWLERVLARGSSVEIHPALREIKLHYRDKTICLPFAAPLESFPVKWKEMFLPGTRKFQPYTKIGVTANLIARAAEAFGKAAILAFSLGESEQDIITITGDLKPNLTIAQMPAIVQ